MFLTRTNLCLLSPFKKDSGSGRRFRTEWPCTRHTAATGCLEKVCPSPNLETERQLLCGRTGQVAVKVQRIAQSARGWERLLDLETWDRGFRDEVQEPRA